MKSACNIGGRGRHERTNVAKIESKCLHTSNVCGTTHAPAYMYVVIAGTLAGNGLWGRSPETPLPTETGAVWQSERCLLLGRVGQSDPPIDWQQESSIAESVGGRISERRLYRGEPGRLVTGEGYGRMERLIET